MFQIPQQSVAEDLHAGPRRLTVPQMRRRANELIPLSGAGRQLAWNSWLETTVAAVNNHTELSRLRSIAVSPSESMDLLSAIFLRYGQCYTGYATISGLNTGFYSFMAS